MEILELILFYASMWGPAIVSILGIAATVIIAIGKVVKALQGWQSDAQTSKDAADQLHADMKRIITENHNLQRYNQKLLEEMTRIMGYDIQKEEPTDEEK